MRLRSFPDAGPLAHAAADIVDQVVAERPNAVLGLPSGRTVIPLYRELAARRARGEAPSYGAVIAFNLDELVLPPGHPASFAAYMDHHAGTHIGLDRWRSRLPRTAGDLAAACHEYDEAIRGAGGFDLAIVGIGADGHIAYNLPGSTHSAAHVVSLPDATAANLGVPPTHWPLLAVTLGFAPLLAARHLMLLATSGDKEAAMRALLSGPPDLAWPCTALRDHPNFDVLLTRELAEVSEGPENRR